MSLPPGLPMGLPPLPKSLTGVASPRGGDHLSQKSVASFGALEQHIINGTGPLINQHEGSLSSTQDSISDRDSMHSRASSSLSAHDMPTSTSTLDTQIALLRREMYSLRQLDLSLLSQLWALNESIQSFRTVLQDREDVTPSPTPSNTNSISSDGEQDDQSFSPLPPASSIPIAAGNGSSASTSTSASNSLPATNTAIAYSLQPGKASKHIPLTKVWPQQSGRISHVQQRERRTCSQQNFGKTTHSKHFDGKERSQPCEDRSQSQMSDSSGRSQKILVSRSQSNESAGRRTHPQLPAILQQRMRRPPPPPPPSRSTGMSPNKTQEQQLTV